MSDSSGGPGEPDRPEPDRPGLGRIRLFDLPAAVLDALAGELGARAVHEVPASSGFSRAVASTVTLDDGRRVFVKAAPRHAADPVRNGIRLAAVHGELGPRLLAALDVDEPVLVGTDARSGPDDGGPGWVVAVHEHLAGREVEWTPDAVPALVDLLDRLAPAAAMAARRLPDLVPLNVALASQIGTWSALAGCRSPARDPRLLTPDQVRHLVAAELWPGMPLLRLAELESGWFDLVVGEVLQHGDLRRDNLIEGPDGRLTALDWTHLWAGPGWADAVLVGVDIARAGLDPEPVLTASVWRGAPRGAVDCLLAALAGYWFNAGHRSPLPHAPGLRELQRDQGLAALRWLAARPGAGRIADPSCPA